MMKLRKSVIFVSWVITVIAFSTACNNKGNEGGFDDSQNLEIKRYKIEILACDKLGDNTSSRMQEELVQLAIPIIPKCQEANAFLPNADSKVLGVAWNENPEISLFVQKPCTGTQVTAKTCTQSVIVNAVRSKIGVQKIESFALSPEVNDSTKVANIINHIGASTRSNTKIYILTESKDADQMFTLPDTSYKHCYNSVDSIRAKIEEDICKNAVNFTIIYNPPTEKSEKPATVLIKLKKENVQIKNVNKPIVKSDDKDRIYTNFKRIPDKNEVEWSKSFTENAERLTLRFTVNGIVSDEDVTHKTQYHYTPGKKEAQTHYTTVELIPDFGGKKIKVVGPLILTNQKFNCE